MKRIITVISAWFLYLFFSGSNFLCAQSLPDFLINEHACPNGADQSYPDMSSDGNGNFVVVWQDSRSGNYSSDIYARIYAEGGFPQGGNFKVNDDTGNATQHDPCVGVDNQMNFVIAWYDSRESAHGDIYAQRFSSDGNPLGQNFRVTDDTCDALSLNPAIAFDNLGNFIIVWHDNRNGDEDVFCQRYSSEGVAAGNNFRVNADTGNDDQYWPDCAFANDGSFIITWNYIRSSWDFDIIAQRFDSDGMPVGENFQVNTDLQDAHHSLPKIITDAEGGFKICWYDTRNSDYDIYIQCYQSNGNPIGDNLLIDGNPPGTHQWHPSITGDQAGNFILCWDDDRDDYGDVYARRYNSDCTPLGNCFKVNDDTTALHQFYPCIASVEGGNFMVVWTDLRNGWFGDIYGQFFSGEGSPVGENVIINDDFSSENQQFPAMVVDGSGTMIFCWNDEREYIPTIYAQRISADGAPVGENFRVVDDSLTESGTDAPSVAADDEGNFVIAWADFRNGYCYDVWAQRYAMDGSALGSNFLVSVAGGCMHYSPVVSYKEDGNFIIVWWDTNDGGGDKGDDPDIWAQLYISDGTPAGDNFMVNENVEDSYQTDPALAVDANGNFLIAWKDDRNGNDQIYVQRFQFDGTPVGTNFPVEDQVIPSIQADPSLSCDEDGNFTVVWRDNRNGSFDIFGRRFFSDGSPSGESFQVNADTLAAFNFRPRVAVQQDGKFVVSWICGEYGDYDVWAQRFFSNGSPDSLNFMIPNTMELDQSFQNISLKDDYIYSVWQDNCEGQFGYDIRANVLPWDLSVGIADRLVGTGYSGFSRNYPNPFRTTTTISFYLEKAGPLQLNIYDLSGKLIRSNAYEVHSSGENQIEISGNDMTKGIWLYQIIANGEISETKKMILVK